MLDMDMPVLDGFETARSLPARELREGRRRTKVLATTAYALEEQRQRCAGCDAHLTKPIVKARLLSEIARCAAAPAPILAFTPNPRVRSQLALVWGVETFLVPSVAHTDDMVVQVDRALLDIGRVTYGDRVVIVAGVPPGIPGTTNGRRVHLVASGGKRGGVAGEDQHRGAERSERGGDSGADAMGARARP